MNKKISINYRAYFWTNMYLSPIQKGIQTAHCVSELYMRYFHRPNLLSKVVDWADHSQTIITLNGGSSDDLDKTLQTRFLSNKEVYPWAVFRESKEALNGSTTCIGILVSEKIYSEADTLRKKSWSIRNHSAHGLMIHFERLRNKGLTDYDLGLVILISNSKLAN